MDIESKTENGILFLKPLDKSIEAGNSRDFKVKVSELIGVGHKWVVLNLNKVEFMDSSGLGSLISIIKLLAANQGKMVISNANSQVMMIFNLTGLHNVFQFFSTEKEALDSLLTLSLNKNG